MGLFIRLTQFLGTYLRGTKAYSTSYYKDNRAPAQRKSVLENWLAWADRCINKDD